MTASNELQIFTILALDHGASLASAVRPRTPQEVSRRELAEIKMKLLRELATKASAVLLDPDYGLPPAIFQGALPGHVGLVTSVEDGDYATIREPARLLPDWNVAKAKQAGANAIKCFFYYRPDDAAFAQIQERFVSEIVQDCHDHDIPLFAEPLSYDTTAADRESIVIETARRISALGIDILKIEFPVDIQVDKDEALWAQACSKISAVSQVPWVLLSAGVGYEDFTRQVRIACQSGASGYMAGRAVWKEAVSLQGLDMEKYLCEVVAPRLQQLAEIARTYARPWTDFYPLREDTTSEAWYKNTGAKK
jgi:tagatose-1,6-bisphosphate aldolase